MRTPGSSWPGSFSSSILAATLAQGRQRLLSLAQQHDPLDDFSFVVPQQCVRRRPVSGSAAGSPALARVCCATTTPWLDQFDVVAALRSVRLRAAARRPRVDRRGPAHCSRWRRPSGEFRGCGALPRPAGMPRPRPGSVMPSTPMTGSCPSPNRPIARTTRLFAPCAIESPLPLPLLALTAACNWLSAMPYRCSRPGSGWIS